MKLTGEYSWGESAVGLEISIPLKGSKAAEVDVYGK